MTEPQHQATALSWGVKQSFRSYVEATGGTIEVGAGAARAEDGGFTFALAPDSDLRLGADGALTGVGKFLGEVKFDSHGGMLKVFLADPILEIRATGAVLTVADTPKRDYRVEVANLDLAGLTRDAAGEIALPAGLAMFGIQWLGDHYPMKTALDPVRLTLAAG
ncbi:HtaA domain-containing protein [Phenylobacterium aquaticum]|uniref:HtaA domain-containing protein n=1 Tax=Phenylobacterium aquaticum TaxID=1763816 RepID=UPI0026EF1BF5|nr:HtaA domain-containing protein [Phenylobacterium aquaticum]